MSDWGHKITVHIYIGRDPREGELQALAEATNVVVPDADFVGVDVKRIEDEPHDQIAT